MPANVDAMVREGIAAFQAGKTEEARTLLLKAVELDQRNEEAWLWLSGLVESEEEKRTCLENVLVINPNNQRAKAGLQKLLGQAPGGAVKAPPPPPPANPFTVNFEDEFPSSVEWGGATDSPPPPPRRAANEPTSQEYDEWLQSLNLPDTSASTASPPAFSQDIADYLSNPLSQGDSEPLPAVPAAPAPSAAPNVFDNDFFSSTFDTPDLFADAPPAAPSPPAAPTTPPDYLFEEEPAASAVPIPPKASTAKPAPQANLIEDEEDEFLELEDDLLGGGLLQADDFDEAMEDMELTEYLTYIPEGIKATRLPGTNESYPFSMKFGLFVLVVMNVGAAAFLALQVMG